MITNQQIIQDLVASRAIIANPENWTKEAWARNKQDRTVDTPDPTACKFCVLGAVYKAVGFNPEYHSRYVDRRAALASEALSHSAGGSLLHFNDHDDTTHEQVLGLFDKTITRLLAA